MGFVAVGTAWGLKRQTAFGSTATGGFTYIPFISESIAKNYDMLEIVDSESRFKKANGVIGPLGRLSVAGDTNTYVEPDNVGYPLYFLLGAASVATGTPVANVNTHTFDVSTDIPYFTSEYKYGTVTDNKGKRVYNCKLKGATFDFADTALTITWNVAASDYSGFVALGTTITNPTGRKFTFKDIHSGGSLGLTVLVGNSGGTLNTGVKVKSGQLQIDNGLILDDFYQGSQTVQQIDVGKLMVGGNFEVIFDDTSNLTPWLEGQSGSDIIIRYEGDTITGTSQKYVLQFSVPNCWVKNHSIPMTNNQVIVRRIEFESLYDVSRATGFVTDGSASGGRTLEVQLINATNYNNGSGYTV